MENRSVAIKLIKLVDAALKMYEVLACFSSPKIDSLKTTTFYDVNFDKVYIKSIIHFAFIREIQDFLKKKIQKKIIRIFSNLYNEYMGWTKDILRHLTYLLRNAQRAR